MRAMRLTMPVILLALFVFPFVASAVPVPGPMKWSQPIYRIGSDATGAGIYWGWDELSFRAQGNGPQVADDWECKDQRPVTDFHWWGSYIDWKDPAPPPNKVVGFWFGIYTDIPKQPGVDFSRPGQLIWQYQTNVFKETFVGWDVLMPGTPPIEATFQYNVFLPTTDWFYQPGGSRILWLSIRGIEPTGSFQEWGWKTRPHYFMDDAVRGFNGGGWQPIYGPDGLSWDMAFEISTIPEPSSLLALGAGVVGFVGFAARRRRSR